jgi:hypothetical protein
MYLQIVIVLLFLLSVSTFELSLGEENQSNSENYSISKETISRVTEIPKIHSILTEWQNSPYPEELAAKLNLPHKENKIAVYIYLEDHKLESELPSNIEVISSSKNFIRAFVTSDELYELEKLDFVNKITPPVLAQTPPIPKVETPEDKPQEEDNSNLWILVPIVLGIVTIFALKIKKTK